MAVCRFLLPVLLACLAPCAAAQHVNHGSAGDMPDQASTSGNDKERVATVRGRAGIATIDGDSVQLKGGVVYVNGQSWGKVPEPCEVRLVATQGRRSLFVDGQLRHPPAAPQAGGQ